MTSHRIGIDARLLYYRQGGIPAYTRQLIRALAPLDTNNQYAIVHHFRDRTSHLPDPPAPNFHRINALTPAHHRLERLALSLEMLPRQLDLFHSPDFIAPRRAARRHVITIHDLHFITYPQFLSKEGLAYYQNNIQAAVQRADHILVQTETTKQEVVQQLGVPPEKMTVHLLGIDPAFRPLNEEAVRDQLDSYGLPRPYLLFVGTIEPRKNIPALLEAYAALRATLPDAPHLVLAGQPGWHVEAQLAGLDGHNLHGHVTWLQNVPDEVLPALYSGAEALILPSHYEGFGMPAVEAMACGTPVVVSDRGALPEVVGEAGLFINADQPDSLTAAIERLLTDSQLASRLRQAGLARAADFTWEYTARVTLGVYQSLLAD